MDFFLPNLAVLVINGFSDVPQWVGDLDNAIEGIVLVGGRERDWRRIGGGGASDGGLRESTAQFIIGIGDSACITGIGGTDPDLFQMKATDIIGIVGKALAGARAMDVSGLATRRAIGIPGPGLQRDKRAIDDRLYVVSLAGQGASRIIAGGVVGNVLLITVFVLDAGRLIVNAIVVFERGAQGVLLQGDLTTGVARGLTIGVAKTPIGAVGVAGFVPYPIGFCVS